MIDQGALGGGTTWHSSGLISLMKPSSVETKLTKLSKDLYLELQHKEGYYTGWKEVGSLYVAQTEDRMQYYKSLKSESIAREVECDLVTPNDCKDLCPALEISDLKGGLWVPGDGVANPYEICLALSHLAAGESKLLLEKKSHCNKYLIFIFSPRSSNRAAMQSR